MEVFIYNDGALWRWYVLNGSHVMDQGVAKTVKGAEGKAERSKDYLSDALVGT